MTATIEGNDILNPMLAKQFVDDCHTAGSEKDLSQYLVNGELPNTADVQVNDNPKITDEATVIPAKGSVKLIKVLEGAGKRHNGCREKAIFKLEQEVNSQACRLQY